MGYLNYGARDVFEFDDRTLAHLQPVILSKLSRQESFAFTWNDGSHRRSIWLHPVLTLSFQLTADQKPEINRAWLHALTKQANSPAGLRVVQEPAG